MAAHEFLKDSKNSDIFAMLQKPNSIQEREALIRILYKDIHLMTHPDVDTFIFDKAYLGMDKTEVYPNILRLLHLVLEDVETEEVQLLLGSGSGKSFLVCIILAYKTHQLLSLVDPARYYGLSSSMPIAIINMSTSAPQAMNVIFKLYSNFIEKIRSFENVAKKYKISFEKEEEEYNFDITDKELLKQKYAGAQGKIDFIGRNIMSISGHSRPEAFYGYGIFTACADECDFLNKKKSFKKTNAIEEQTTQGEEIIQGLKKAIGTRFGKDGLLFLPSTPLAKTAPLTRRVLETKQHGIELDFHTGQIVDDSTILKKDRIRVYKQNEKLAVQGSTWLFNPRNPRNYYIKSEDDIKALRDYGAEPPDAAFGALPDPEILEENCNYERQSPLTDDQTQFLDWFMPDSRFSYFIHCDLALSGDNAAIAMVHRDHDIGMYVLDFVMEIITSKEKRLSFARTKSVVLALVQRGFYIAKLTTDGFQSEQLRQEIEAFGIETERYSVDGSCAAYDTLIECLYSKTFDYYFHETLIKEIKYLENTGEKYDHPDKFPDGTKGSKDCSDAASGALMQCIMAVREVLVTPATIAKATKGVRSFNGEVIINDEQLPYCEFLPDMTLHFNGVFPNTFLRTVYIENAKEGIWYICGSRLGDVFTIDLIENIDTDSDDFDEIVKSFHNTLKIRYYALSRDVSYTIVDILKQYKYRIISVENQTVADRAKNRNISSQRNVTFQIIQNALNAMDKGNLKIASDSVLVQELYSCSESNWSTKNIVKAIAGWYYYAIQDTKSLNQGDVVLPILQQKEGSNSNLTGMVRTSTPKLTFVKPRLVGR